MNIQILHMVEGAKQAKGIAVIIDVFRAFTVETYLMRGNAEKIIPVGDVEVAFQYKKAHPNTILCGERNGVMIEGFQYGNSPSQLEHADLTGLTVVHTTSAGTQGIANAKGADEILGAGLVTAKAVAEYIKKSGAEDVSLVCMGLAAESETEEDTLCAEYIKSLLTGGSVDMEKEIENLKVTSGAKFFDPAQKEVFPTEDFAMCTEVDKFDFVLRLKTDGDGLAYMEKICL